MLAGLQGGNSRLFVKSIWQANAYGVNFLIIDDIVKISATEIYI
jgi:hypothetical protein